nr:AgmX/PglI C-terminal domain-containing protein [Motiliproteus sp. SC1-56]
MKKSLDSLKALASVDALRSQKLERSSASTSTRPEQDLIAARAAQDSGGIELSKVDKPQRQALSEREGTAVATPAEDLVAAAEQSRGERTREEIARVFDRNKDAFYALYRRALRKNLGLAGDVVFELTIAPSGEVSAVTIRRSGLDDDALTRKLLARIRMFDFGARPVPPWQGTYTVTFSPAG